MTNIYQPLCFAHTNTQKAETDMTATVLKDIRSKHTSDQNMNASYSGKIKRSANSGQIILCVRTWTRFWTFSLPVSSDIVYAIKLFVEYTFLSLHLNT